MTYGEIVKESSAFLMQADINNMSNQ